MITCYFGVPGVGKNTLLTMFAIKELFRKKLKLPGAYDHIYSDFYIKGAEKFDYSYFKTHKVYNSLILIEEMGLNADNRKFKSFTNEERDYFVLHRHLGNDIIYATQDYSMVDSKIRALTQELWYMSKSVVPLLKHFTFAKRIYRCVNINENSGELTMGYRFCNLIESLFVSNCKFCFRPFYYKYFDSFDEGPLADRPILESELWASSVSDQEETRNPLKRFLTKARTRKASNYSNVTKEDEKQKRPGTILAALKKADQKDQEDTRTIVHG